MTFCILSDYNGIILEINNKRKYRKNTWKLSNTFLNDHLVIEVVREN
jgi:hypothetical protein